MAAGLEGQPFDTAYVCVQVDCKEAGGENLLEGLKQRLAGVDNPIAVEPYMCFGNCFEKPVIVLAPEGPIYTRVGEQDLDEIAASTQGEPIVERLLTAQDEPNISLIHTILGAERAGKL